MNKKKQAQALDLSNVMQWVAITDCLPELNEWVLCGHTTDEWTDLAEINQDGKGKIVFWNRECEIYPTHWCKLPEPPCA